MPNPLALSGAQPPRPSHKAPLYQGARFTTGLWTNRSALRDAASTRLIEKFYGPFGDAFLGGENLEITQRLTLGRRPGNSVWNSNTWTNINSFYEFRLFNANVEQIKTVIDTQKGLYDASSNAQTLIWNKSPYSGQSYLQSVGNILFWGDGSDQKKWINTLQTRIPYSSVLTEIASYGTNSSSILNPYNFTPFILNSFVVDTNGNTQQLIGTVLQLSSFYVLNSSVVFTMKSTDSFGNPLPTAGEVLSPGLQIYFDASSQVAQVLSQTAITLTIANIVGGVSSASVYFGGSDYLVNDVVNINQTTPSGSMNGSINVASIGNSAGTGYTTQSGVATTTSGSGSSCTLNITATSGGLVSATVAAGGVNYAVGDYIFPTQSGASGGYFKVTGVTVSTVTSVVLCTGVVKTITINAAGTGYYTAGAVPTTGGTGKGLALNIVDNKTEFSCSYTYGGGSITTSTIGTPGTGYVVGDFLYPIVAAGSKATGGKLQVTAIYGVPSALTLSYGGPTFTGYTVASGLPTTTSGAGTSATFNILSVASGQISTYSIGTIGSGYKVGDSLIPTQATGAGAFYSVSGIYGPAGAATLTSGGPSFTGYTVASGLATTTSGAGLGCTVNITSVASGQITGIAVNVGGSGYNIGDHIYPTQPSGAGADYTVATVSGTAVATLTQVNPGYLPYTVGTVPTTTSGTGSSATINITAVSGSQITSGVIVSQGTGYAVGDKLYPTEAGTSGTAYFTVSAVNATTGGIAAITQENPGYLPYTVASGVPTTTSGTGIGATVNITTVSSGAITAGALNAAGTGYQIGDKLYPTQAGTSGSAYFTVTTLSAATGGVATVSVIDPGTGYATQNNLSTTTSGIGTGCTVNLVVSSSSYYPPASTADVIPVYSGGNPISSYTSNSSFVWNTTLGGETIDGSALWFNRGPATDGGIVYNWGIKGSTGAPVVVVNGASSSWASNTYYNRWMFIVVTVSGKKYLQQLVTGGKSGSVAPSWSTTTGQITTDGTAQWKCLSNDGDTTLTWASSQKYTSGHVIQDTPGVTTCVYQLQPYSGIMTQGSNFPIYYWQCNSQSGSDVGAAGEIPNGTSGNKAMALNGGQTLSTATGQGTINSLYLACEGGSNPVRNYPIAGDGTVSSSPTQVFSGTENLSISMFPTLVIPAAGTYTFTIGHQVAMFWGIGKGSIELNVTQISVAAGYVTVTCDRDISSTITAGIDLTFAGLSAATWLNGQTVTVTGVSGRTFTGAIAHADYGPAPDTGTASSTATLVPSVVSGPTNWIPAGSPNIYNFSTGTPVKGYAIMSANYPPQGNTLVVDTVQITFPAAGVYPAEIQYGVWYHSTGGYTTPTVSPTLPATTYSFYIYYTPPGSTTNYNIIPEGIACSSVATPTFPDWPSTLANLQNIAPSYPSVTETSGNFTWWNIGPVPGFDWTAAVSQTTNQTIIDPNSNQELPYAPGVSGTAEPTFATLLNELTADLSPLVWINSGPVGLATPSGALTTTQGGWKYCAALVSTLDDTVSNASLISSATGSFFEASGVLITGGLPDVIDPQADYVALFRTQDGGATFYLIPPPVSGNGNTEYTVPLQQYLTSGFTDTNTDEQLQTLIQAPLALENSVPPQGIGCLAFQDNRIFGRVGNVVYWSSGPDTPVGNGYNGFYPDNFAEFPSLVTRLVPLNIGMLVFTVSDIYLISGNGTASSPFVSRLLIERMGLLSYNALTVNGSIVYFMTTDNQVIELNVHSGLSVIGFPIADILETFNPGESYLTWHVNGSNDQCLFVADGSTGWYRMSPTPAPEAGVLSWSLKANIVGGCGAIQSIETTPGNIEMLLGPPAGYSGQILKRDYGTYADDGTTYPANFLLGSIVLAFPGQVGAPEFITTDCIRASGSQPISLGVRIGEISGEFQDLIFWTNDPPQLPPSESLYNQRFYMSQTTESVLCRHMQVYGEFSATNSADELVTLTIYGGYLIEG